MLFCTLHKTTALLHILNLYFHLTFHSNLKFILEHKTSVIPPLSQCYREIIFLGLNN